VLITVKHLWYKKIAGIGHSKHGIPINWAIFVGMLTAFDFSKYQGTGNDFVMVDNRELQFPSEDLTLIRQICHRKFGIGSDGLILIEEDSAADFHMNFFNPDGSKSYCGNGSRCAVHFANQLGMVGTECSFRAIDGVHKGRLEEISVRTSILPVTQIEKRNSHWLINTGSPHYIVFCDDTEAIDLITESHNIRFNEEFREKGVNVNFVEITSPQSIRMRTYERGVENETLSCGTGVTAAAIAHLINGGEKGRVEVRTRGGQLSVQAEQQHDGTFCEVWLSGPVQQTFTGKYTI